MVTLRDPAGAATGTDPAAPPAALERRVFTVAGHDVRWRDVVGIMQETGDWVGIRQRAAEGVSLQAAEQHSPSATDRRAAAREFRYQRRLLTAEELAAWLERWDLPAPAWADWVDRSLRLDAAGGGTAGSVVVGAAAPVLGGPTWAEAVCSGRLEAAAEQIAGWMAARAEATGISGRAPFEWHAGELRGAWEARWAEPPPESEVEALVQRFALDWLTIELEWATFAGPDAAKEAVACCRHDGATLEEVALRGVTQCSSATVLAEELPAARRSAAVSAPVGLAVLAGIPGETDTVLVVRQRVPARIETPLVRRRAEDTWRRLRAAALIGRWIRWDERSGSH